MNTLSFDSIELGTQLPPIVKEIDQTVITRNAVASLDFNPIHTNPAWAKEVNLLGEGTTIAHGLCTVSFMTSVVTDWCYSRGGYMQKLESKFIAPVRPGDVITCTGEVTEIHPRVHSQAFVVISIKASNQTGTHVAVASANVNIGKPAGR